MTPLNDREKRALKVWGAIIGLLGLYDFDCRGASTLSEACRAIRRRTGKHPWRLGASLLAGWFIWRHVEDLP